MDINWDNIIQEYQLNKEYFLVYDGEDGFSLQNKRVFKYSNSKTLQFGFTNSKLRITFIDDSIQIINQYNYIGDLPKKYNHFFTTNVKNMYMIGTS